MFNYKEKDPIALLDPEVKDPTELIAKLEDINPSVLKEVIIERVKGGVTQRQHDLLMSVLLRSDF